MENHAWMIEDLKEVYQLQEWRSDLHYFPGYRCLRNGLPVKCLERITRDASINEDPLESVHIKNVWKNLINKINEKTQEAIKPIEVSKPKSRMVPETLNPFNLSYEEREKE